MKLNRKYIIQSMCLLTIFIFFFLKIYFFTHRNVSMLNNVCDGMGNPEIVAYYQKEIDDVKTITNSKSINIKYCEADLNEDGRNDYIVFIRSVLHTGSHGDTFEILMNEGNSFREALSMVVPLFYQDKNMSVIGEILELNTKTNGYRDLEVMSGNDTHFFLKYDGAGYQYVEY